MLSLVNRYIQGKFKFSIESFYKILIYSLLPLIIIPFKSFPQVSDIVFERIFLDRGLSQSIVKCIIQDKNGFMFFGTEDGLNKFDGYKFTVIRNNPDDVNSLSYNDINALCEDRNGFIWIGTFNSGLNKYDQSKRKFTRFRNDPANDKTISHDNINAIIEDKDGNIWIGTDNGLNKLMHKPGENTYTFLRYYHDPGNKNSLSGNMISSLFQDSEGSIWVGTGSSLNKIIVDKDDPGKYTFIRFVNNPLDNNSIGSNAVRSIYEDSKGTLWIGTDNGLNKKVKNENGKISFLRFQNNPLNSGSISHNEVYAICEDNDGLLWLGTNGGGITTFDSNKNKFKNYRNDIANPRSIGYDEIRCIYKDRGGIMWIGTYGSGINKVYRSANQFLHYSPGIFNINNINNSIVWAIMEDEEGFLWIGTHGGGINKYDKKNNSVKSYLNNPNNINSLSDNVVRVITIDNNGFLWIGTNGGGVNRFDRNEENFTIYKNDPEDPSSLSYDNIRAIYQDKNGTIWIGTYGGGLDKFNPESQTFTNYRNDPYNNTSLSNNFVRTIYEDNAGNFWIGTDGGGLNKFDRENETFISFRSNLKDSTSINNDYIFSIYEDKNGILWIGTWGGGINRFDPATEKFSAFTTEDGLPSDAVYGILDDEAGNLWISTNKGISKFNPVTKEFKNYNIRDGLQDNEFNGGSYFKSKQGELFFGGINGFNAFFPSNIKENDFIPPVVITSFQKLNREVEFEKPVYEINEIELSYEDYIFSFEFTSLDYSAPEKNRYAYMMEGLDHQWFYTGADKRFAYYTTLPPGNYTFKVKGTNSEGLWNENAASINIIITPPFWQTWWFISLTSAFIIAFGFIGYKRRLKNVRMKTELKTAHDAQMSIMPHSDPDVEGLEISSICIPAYEVGGDFFDYFGYDDKNSSIGIIIGDVSGKAMNSAMTAVMTSGMLITETNEADSISDILNRVNRPLYSKTKKNMFVATCIAAINSKNNRLIFTNAGLCNPILKSNGKIEILQSEGPRFPLGMVENVNYSENIVNIKPGDIILFMTDGIIEAKNQSGELYSEERLINLLSKLNSAEINAREIKNEIIKDVKYFSGKQPQHDDISLVVVKVKK